jgi:hypothetical protein
MSSKQKTPQPAGEPEFVRKTITIPVELELFANDRSNQPEHAGNFSSYVRTLILRDRAEKQAA